MPRGVAKIFPAPYTRPMPTGNSDKARIISTPAGTGRFVPYAFSREVLAALPQKPGVYLLEDEEGRVIYVGKAVRLRSRLRGYLRLSPQDGPRIRYLKASCQKLEIMVTDSEQEAYLLEDTLIKRFRPKFNVQFRDDKTYPYIRISAQEAFPKLSVVRRMRGDGARYFGPYVQAGSMWETIRLMQEIFQIATCKIAITGKEPRACLEFQIHRCSAPCTGEISQADYRASVDRAVAFLQGRQEEVLSALEREMREASAALNFERAAVLRDRLFAVRSLAQKQKMVLRPGDDLDVVGYASLEEEGALTVMTIRAGRVLGQQPFLMETPLEREEALHEGLSSYYGRCADLPKAVCLPFAPARAQELAAFLKARRGRKVEMTVPQRGKRRELVELACENARAHLEANQRLALRSEQSMRERVGALQKLLSLPSPPRVIEGVDISHFQGEETVGSLVVFRDGLPEKRSYRRYRVAAASGDDLAALAEVVTRRLKRLRDEGAPMPDLMMADGGVAQLSVALKVLSDLKVSGSRPLLCALAKRREEVYLPGRSLPVAAPLDHAGLQLLMHVRDEAHRFARDLHRRRKRNKLRASLLDLLPSVGPKRKQKILHYLGSLDSLWEADWEALGKAAGLSEKEAAAVREALGLSQFAPQG